MANRVVGQARQYQIRLDKGEFLDILDVLGGLYLQRTGVRQQSAERMLGALVAA